MLQVVAPVFLVILVGYLVGRRSNYGGDAEKLVNDYVLYIALPALLFLAIARTEPADLGKSAFLIASLSGIAAAYLCGYAWSVARGVAGPKASLAGMAACYGTTGYMGIPILIAAFGPEAAVPAAIATIVHNIPAIVTVVLTHDLATSGQAGLAKSLVGVTRTTFRNPLVLAVLAGALVSVVGLPLPAIAERFATFLGAAAGPTALFALGLGLARLRFSREALRPLAWDVVPTVFIKILIQPAVTLGVMILLVGAQVDVWFAAAIIMAAQPVGAGAYVFAVRYGYFETQVSLAIILSLLTTIATLTLLLHVFAGQLAG